MVERNLLCCSRRPAQSDAFALGNSCAHINPNSHSDALAASDSYTDTHARAFCDADPSRNFCKRNQR